MYTDSSTADTYSRFFLGPQGKPNLFK
uniref:Uncharacterized protein n=1 Tax=Anguilla anguilla TaxID=7936 RepID=A0A0E9SHK3_ANGAN